MSDLLLHGDQVLWPDGTLGPGWVLVQDGEIAATARGNCPGAADLEAAVLSPGFVDMHCHGGGGHTFCTTDPDEALAATLTHRRHGTTQVMASLVTASPEELAAQVAALAPLAEAGEIAGIHLEGPWLSPEHRGAHSLALLREPDLAEVEDLLARGRGHIRMVTLAPELPGGIELVSFLCERGVVAAIGHTSTDDEGLRAAVDAGASVVTHLCNAMLPIHHRRPGPVVAALADPRLTVELIADGVHVHPEVIALVGRSARSRLALITDAMAAAGADDGHYELGGLDVDVVDGVARLTDGGAIAGSTLTMDRAVRTAVAAGIPLADALVAATTTPAEALGREAGRLVDGGAADLVLLDDDLHVTRTIRGGAVLS